MSSDHHPRGIQPPNATVEHHHHLSPPSYTTGNNQHLPEFTVLPLPQTPSPAKTPTKSVETNTTPESRIAAAIGSAIFNIRSNSLQDVVAAATGGAATNSPLIRTLSDGNSSVNQDPSITTTTPPKIPINNNPLRRTLSDSITTNYQQQQQMIRTNKPIRRTILDATEYQEFNKTAPESSIGKLSPHSKRLKILENMVMEIEQRCLEIMSEDDIPNPDPNPTQVNKEDKDESIGVERLKNGDVKFELDCSCGKRFEMLIKHNGYCFYKVA